MVVFGIILTVVQTASTTFLQENTSEDMIGRVFGLFGSVYSLALPLGMVIFGPLADYISLKVLMIVSGIALVMLGSYSLWRKTGNED
jgi:DHA3 family macrolide efflux protein-like MFS transporter